MNIINISETFKNSVREQVAKGGHVRWGEAESVEAIVAVYSAALANVTNAFVQNIADSGVDEVEAKAILENVQKATAADSASARVCAAKVVNPSAFAQLLEKLPDGHPSHINRPKRGTGGAKAALDV